MTDTTDLRPHIRKHLEAGDKSGGVMTRDGKEVVIYTADAPGPYPIHGYDIESADEVPAAWSSDGKRAYHSTASRHDLILRPAPKRRVKGWWIVLKNGTLLPRGFRTKEIAKIEAKDLGQNAFACIEINVEEGEGL